MSDPVFFAPEVPPPGAFVLGGDEGRHAAGVRRMRVGETLQLADGFGRWAAATISAVGKGNLTVNVGEAATDAAPQPRVVLIQALPKGERSDLAVDLATQAGVDEIVPWQAARCVARWDSGSDCAQLPHAAANETARHQAASNKAERGREKWQRVAREAAKQSRRHTIPPVRPLASTAHVVDLLRAADCALVLHEAESRPLASVDLSHADGVVLVVGPEGGIAPGELAAFRAAGAHPVRLGREVLRTSSAAAVALGALGVLTGRWS